MNQSFENYLHFSIGTEQFAMPLPLVKEVVDLSATTPFPGPINYFIGVINRSGEVISIIDLRIKMKAEALDCHYQTSVIILDLESVAVGVVVDSVEGVISISKTELLNPSSFELVAKVAKITGAIKRNEKVIYLIDGQSILNYEDYKILQSRNTAQLIA